MFPVWLVLLPFSAVVEGATNCFYSSALLSYTFSHRARVIPNFEPFIITPEEDLLDILLDPLNITVNRFFSADEVGTHVDMPGRFHVDGYRVGEIPFCDFFLVPGIKVDVKAKAARNRDYEVTVEDLEEWVCENGPLPPRFIALFDFGWSDRYDDARRYFGDDSLLDLLLPLQYSWPGLSLEAAEFLVQCSSQCVAVGVDSPGVDTGFNTSPAEAIPPLEPVSRYLTRYGVYLLENLQLRGVSLPNRGFFVTVGVINLQVNTAAPAYVVAEYCENPYPELICAAPCILDVLYGVPYY
ncbi:uncharacterized protein LOC128993479 [Macrosteles quadrilineatus]|uniref:uncharacterized protein LOC128993479 n=1 Tax=Macrosteles quadrilineatus TaxID=74068 RepID=UPI0023E30FF8|nr:uncharacterized protein LOC128993479 [Macrosteles quadrilineatus]